MAGACSPAGSDMGARDRTSSCSRLARASAGLLLAAAPCACARSEAIPAGPRLLCEEPTHDFGIVWEGTLLEHEFRLRVAGSEDLVVNHVRADCGCTVAELLSVGEGISAPDSPIHMGTPLAPESELRLRVRYDTRGRRGDVPRQIRVYGNQAEGSTVLTLEADVRPWLVVDPDRPIVVQALAKEGAEASLRVESAVGERFGLAPSGEGIPPSVHVEASPVDDPVDGRAQAWNVRVRVEPGLAIGTHRFPIHLVSDVARPAAPEHPERGFFSVAPVLAVQVQGPVALSDEQVVFGVIGADELVARTVRVSSKDRGFGFPEPKVRFEPLRETDLDLASSSRIRVRAVEGSSAWDIELSFDGLTEGPSGNLLGVLVVETGHPDVPLLKAQVHVTRLAPAQRATRSPASTRAGDAH